MRALVVAALVFAASPAFAQTEPNAQPGALTRAYDCMAIQEDAARLACYDDAVGRLRAAQTSGEVVAVDRVEAERLERESFGFQLPSLGSFLPRLGGGGQARAQIEDLEAQVERIVPRSDGRRAFVMTNGQVWVQTEPQRAGNVRADDTVTIRRAAMGSFMLVSPRGGAGHRVRRES